MTARLQDILLERGLADPGRLAEAVEEANRTRQMLHDVLLERRLVAEADLLRVVAEVYGMDFVSLEERPIASEVIRSVSAKLAAHYGVMPVGFDGRQLTLAVSNPLDVAASDDIETNLGYRVERVLAGRADIQAALRTYYGVGADAVVGLTVSIKVLMFLILGFYLSQPGGSFL